MNSERFFALHQRWRKDVWGQLQATEATRRLANHGDGDRRAVTVGGMRKSSEGLPLIDGTKCSCKFGVPGEPRE